MDEKELHKLAVLYAKGKLEKEFDIQLTKDTWKSEVPEFIDLISDCPGQDQKYAVYVCDNVRFNQNGKISERSIKILVKNFLGLRNLRKKYDMQILVMTDPQVYIQLKKDHPYFFRNIVLKQIPETILIEFPVFENDFLQDKSNNDEFTARQLILAKKLNLIKYDQFPKDVAEVMFLMLDQFGYLRNKPKMKHVSSVEDSEI